MSNSVWQPAKVLLGGGSMTGPRTFTKITRTRVIYPIDVAQTRWRAQ
jgi:hypothetical protein